MSNFFSVLGLGEVQADASKSGSSTSYTGVEHDDDDDDEVASLFRLCDVDARLGEAGKRRGLGIAVKQKGSDEAQIESITQTDLNASFSSTDSSLPEEKSDVAADTRASSTEQHRRANVRSSRKASYFQKLVKNTETMSEVKPLEQHPGWFSRSILQAENAVSSTGLDHPINFVPSDKGSSLFIVSPGSDVVISRPSLLSAATQPRFSSQRKQSPTLLVPEAVQHMSTKGVTSGISHPRDVLHPATNVCVAKQVSSKDHYMSPHQSQKQQGSCVDLPSNIGLREGASPRKMSANFNLRKQSYFHTLQAHLTARTLSMSPSHLRVFRSQRWQILSGLRSKIPFSNLLLSFMFLNFLFFLMACIMLVMGGFLTFHRTRMSMLLNFDLRGHLQEKGVGLLQKASILLMFAGAVTGILCTWSCYGVVRGQIDILQLYLPVVIFLLVIQTVALMMSIYLQDQIESTLLSELLKKMVEYDGALKSSNEFTMAMNAMHAYLGCCGVTSYKDFRSSRWYKRVNQVNEKGKPGINQTRQFPLSCCQLLNPDILTVGHPEAESDLKFVSAECAQRPPSRDNANTGFSCLEKLKIMGIDSTSMLVTTIVVTTTLQIACVVLVQALLLEEHYKREHEEWMQKEAELQNASQVREARPLSSQTVGILAERTIVKHQVANGNVSQCVTFHPGPAIHRKAGNNMAPNMKPRVTNGKVDQSVTYKKEPGMYRKAGTNMNMAPKTKLRTRVTNGNVIQRMNYKQGPGMYSTGAKNTAPNIELRATVSNVNKNPTYKLKPGLNSTDSNVKVSSNLPRLIVGSQNVDKQTAVQTKPGP